METKGTTERYYSIENFWYQKGCNLHRLTGKNLHSLMLDTLKRTGKTENTTQKCLLFLIPWSRKKGPKMASPAFAMSGGNAVTRKHSWSTQESYRRSAKYLIGFKYPVVWYKAFRLPRWWAYTAFYKGTKLTLDRLPLCWKQGAFATLSQLCILTGHLERYRTSREWQKEGFSHPTRFTVIDFKGIILKLFRHWIPLIFCSMGQQSSLPNNICRSLQETFLEAGEEKQNIHFLEG